MEMRIGGTCLCLWTAVKWNLMQFAGATRPDTIRWEKGPGGAQPGTGKDQPGETAKREALEPPLHLEMSN